MSEKPKDDALKQGRPKVAPQGEDIGARMECARQERLLYKQRQRLLYGDQTIDLDANPSSDDENDDDDPLQAYVPLAQLTPNSSNVYSTGPSQASVATLTA